MPFGWFSSSVSGRNQISGDDTLELGVQDPRPRIVAINADSYRLQMQKLVDASPWFGGSPFEVSISKSPPRRINRLIDLAYVRRVMISWLIGRPVTQIAKRAGCSVRYADSIIDGWIYVGSPMEMFPAWTELGLIGILDGPALEYEPSDAEADANPSPYDTTVVCLVCHRQIDGVGSSYYDRRYDESFRDPLDPVISATRYKLPTDTQGHLRVHFLKANFPIRPIRSRTDLPLFGPNRANYDRRLRTSQRARRRALQNDWHMRVPATVFDEIEKFERSGAFNGIYPLVRGISLTREEAIHWWYGSLKGRFKAPRLVVADRS